MRGSRRVLATFPPTPSESFISSRIFSPRPALEIPPDFIGLRKISRGFRAAKDFYKNSYKDYFVKVFSEKICQPCPGEGFEQRLQHRENAERPRPWRPRASVVRFVFIMSFSSKGSSYSSGTLVRRDRYPALSDRRDGYPASLVRRARYAIRWDGYPTMVALSLAALPAPVAPQELAWLETMRRGGLVALAVARKR